MKIKNFTAKRGGAYWEIVFVNLTFKDSLFPKIQFSFYQTIHYLIG